MAQYPADATGGNRCVNPKAWMAKATFLVGFAFMVVIVLAEYVTAAMRQTEPDAQRILTVTSPVAALVGVAVSSLLPKP